MFNNLLDTGSEYCNTYLLFHCNSGWTNAPQCYVIRTQTKWRQTRRQPA